MPEAARFDRGGFFIEVTPRCANSRGRGRTGLEFDMNQHTFDAPVLDQGCSAFQNDATTHITRRAKKYRPYGLGPIVRDFQNGEPIIYAIELADGTVKVGCTRDLALRRCQLQGDLLGFRFGDFDEEKAIHRTLRASLSAKREYYYRTPEVIAFVNELRDAFDLEPLAA